VEKLAEIEARKEWIKTIIRPKYRYDDALIDLLHRCYSDTALFIKTFLIEGFDEPITSQTEKILQLGDDETKPRVCICGWRGMGKTSISIGRVVRNVVFRKRKFIMCVGATHDSAANVTQSIKQFMMSPRVTDVFGNMKARKFRDVEMEFSKTTWFSADPWNVVGKPLTVVMPRGAGQQVKGWNFYIDGQLPRPDEIDIQDLEEDSEIENEDVRAKVRRWFNRSLMKCINTKKQPNKKTGEWPWRIFYQDTLKHRDCNVAHIMQSPGWHTETFPQCKFENKGEVATDYKSLVPEIIPDEAIQREVAIHISEGTMNEFAHEMMCVPTAPCESTISKTMFRYFNDAQEGLQKATGIYRFIIADPARTSKAKSCFTAMLAFAYDPSSDRLYIRDRVRERITEATFYDKLFELSLATNTRVVAVEDTGLEEFVRGPLESERRRRRLPVQFIWLEARGGPKHGDYGSGKDSAKKARFSVMVPWYEKGRVWHENVLRESPMEQALLLFDSPTTWDELDCIGHVPQVMDKCRIFPHPRVTFEDGKSPSFFAEDFEEMWTTSIKNRDFALVEI